MVKIILTVLLCVVIVVLEYVCNDSGNSSTYKMA